MGAPGVDGRRPLRKFGDLTVGRCDINTSMANRRSEFPYRWVIGGHVRHNLEETGMGTRSRSRWCVWRTVWIS